MAGAKLHPLLDEEDRKTAAKAAADLDEALTMIGLELATLGNEIKALQGAIAPMVDEIRQHRADIEQLLRERSYLPPT